MLFVTVRQTHSVHRVYSGLSTRLDLDSQERHSRPDVFGKVRDGLTNGESSQ